MRVTTGWTTIAPFHYNSSTTIHNFSHATHLWSNKIQDDHVVKNSNSDKNMHTPNATKCISHGSAKKANKYHNNSNNSNNELIIVNFTACAFFKSAASVHCIKRYVFSSYVNDQSCLTYAGKQRLQLVMVQQQQQRKMLRRNILLSKQNHRLSFFARIRWTQFLITEDK